MFSHAHITFAIDVIFLIEKLAKLVENLYLRVLFVKSIKLFA
jgi:hypothetical protein